MNDLKKTIADFRKHLFTIGIAGPHSESCGFLDAIEAALFPAGPSPDPAKQFVVGENYRNDGDVRKCLFVFPDGSMGYMDSIGSLTASKLSAWTHIPRNPALEAVKAERDYAARRLAELDAKVKEMEG